MKQRQRKNVRDKAARAGSRAVYERIASILRSGLKHYKLDENHNLVECSLLEWAEFMRDADTQVALGAVGPYAISTVFIGMPRSPAFDFVNEFCFETMVFHDGDPVPHLTKLHKTWAEAEAGHKAMVERIQRGDVDPGEEDHPPALDMVIHMMREADAEEEAAKALSNIRKQNEDQ